KFDIIIPFKDAINYIQSICNDLSLQDDMDFTVCFVSDGCIDGTIDFLAQDFHFKHKIINSNGVGPGSARNTGIVNTDGDYILFIDVDDRISSNYISTFKETANAYHPDIIECMYKSIDPKGKRISGTDLNEFISNESRFLSLLHGKTPRLSWGKAFRRQHLLSSEAFFPEGIHNGEDHIFLLKAYHANPKIEVIFKVLYHWVRHYASLTNRPADIKTIDDFIAVSEMKYEIFTSHISDISDINYNDELLKFSRRTYKEARTLKNKINNDGINIRDLTYALRQKIISSEKLSDINNIIKNDKTSYWSDIMND
ncbi:glycosyltransferase family 2 protein, partial [Escherichia coli]|nr:glycosyltransferase family 2 protein [Escherichia coli]